MSTADIDLIYRLAIMGLLGCFVAACAILGDALPEPD